MKGKSEQSTGKKLFFNNRFIPVTMVEGNAYIAIKPICEALNVDFEAQRVRIQEDEIMSQLPLIARATGADGKSYQMLCFPEIFIYGWLFSISRSDSQELKKYKLICYRVLFNHFHGSFADRVNTLTEQSKIDAQIAVLEQELMQTETGRKIQELKLKKSATKGHLKKLDREIMDSQLSMFDDN